MMIVWCIRWKIILTVLRFGLCVILAMVSLFCVSFVYFLLVLVSLSAIT